MTTEPDQTLTVTADHNEITLRIWASQKHPSYNTYACQIKAKEEEFACSVSGASHWGLNAWIEAMDVIYGVSSTTAIALRKLSFDHVLTLPKTS